VVTQVLDGVATNLFTVVTQVLDGVATNLFTVVTQVLDGVATNLFTVVIQVFDKEATGQFNTQAFHTSSGSFDNDFTTTYPSQSGAQHIGQGVTIHGLPTGTTSGSYRGPTCAASTGITTGGANNLASGRLDLPPVDMTNTNRGSYTQIQPFQPHQNMVCNVISF